MSAAAEFDPDAFMAQRQAPPQPAFDPDAFMAQRRASQPPAPGSDIAHPQLGPSPALAKVGNLLFQDTANAPKHFMNFLSGHPVDQAIEGLQNLTAARQAHLGRAVDAFRAKDYQTAAVQGFFGSVPFLGPALGAAADEWTGGHKPEAVAHAIETLVPFLGDPAINALESQTAARLGAATTRAADVTVAGVGGAIKGGAKAAVAPATFRGLKVAVPGGNVMAGAVGGGAAARALGLPSAAGAIVGGAAPVVQGAIRGARQAIAAKMIGPELLDTFAGLKYGQGYNDLSAAQQEAVLTSAAKAAGKTDKLPESVTQELTRPTEATAPTATASTVPQPPPEALARLNSGVTAPTRAQAPARVQPGAGAEISPIDRIASAPQPAVQPPAAMLSRLNTGVTVNPRAAAQNLFDAMRQSGSIPETARSGESFGGEVQPPDKFIARARETRATSTAQLADILYAGGIRSSDLPNVTADEWAALARAKGLGWPIGKPAQAAWTRDVIAGVKQREGKVQ